MSKGVQFKDKNNVPIYPNPYYPVGSIYLSVNDINPSKWFGGTWEQIAKGRTLVGVDKSQVEFNTVKKIGGSKFLQKHNHKIYSGYDNNGSYGQDAIEFKQAINNRDYYNSATGGIKFIGDSGDGDAGNLQPYFTCYIWCRIA